MKAELLRKQEEVNRIKKPNTLDPFAGFIPKRTSSSSSRSHHKKKSAEIPKPPAVRTESEKQAAEDHEMLAKSKKVLEAKAKLYDNMTNNGGFVNSDDTCLVRFNKKKQDERQPLKYPSSSESDSDASIRDTNYSDDDDEKWTEYTDCLGRTRKCLKDDLEFFRKKDLELAEGSNTRKDRSEERETPWFVDTKGISSADLPLYKPTTDVDTMSMMSKTSKMEEMRIQWEHTEQDNLNREQIHYQDVLFNEARTHGVGYYSFSNDVTERAKQQQVLEKDREKTLEEQQKREQVRLAREKNTNERVFAAKNRQRARLGLPPLPREEIDVTESGNTDKVEESKKERKQKKREEKELKKKEKLEKEREEKRQHHLRPWDQGKDEAHRSSFDDEDKWEYKPEKPEPMSQQQWNDMKRGERNPDFAPPTSTESFNRFTTKKPNPDRNPNFAPPPTESFNRFTTRPEINLDIELPPSTESFHRFTTIKPKPIKRRNENMFNAPIQNELDGNDFPVEQDESNKRRRAEVAPPPTFDYYGPTPTSKPKPKGVNPDLTESIEAGLRFLREKSDKSGPGTKQSWVANTTYEE